MQHLLLFLFGSLVGVASGLLGIGGGIILIPGLIYLFGFTQPEAQGTSLAVMIPPIGIFAALVYYQHGFVRLPVVVWIAVGFMVGAFLGAHLVPLAPVAALRVVFGVLLLYVGFTFVLYPHGTKASAALPAALSAAVVGLAQWMNRRAKIRISATNSEPPSDKIEYHI